jgi:hypothetical protein
VATLIVGFDCANVGVEELSQDRFLLF